MANKGEEGCGTITMPPRDMLAMTAPITPDHAAHMGGFSTGDSFLDDDKRAALFAVLARLRYEYADAMIAARTAGEGEKHG